MVLREKWDKRQKPLSLQVDTGGLKQQYQELQLQLREIPDDVVITCDNFCFQILCHNQRRL